MNIPPLRAIKRSKSDSVVVVDVPGHELRWFQQIRFSGLTSRNSEWLEFGSTSGLRGVFKVAIVDLSVLNDMDLLANSDAGYSRDVFTFRPKLRKE